MNDDVMNRIAAWCADEPGMEFAPGDPPTVTFEGIEMALEASESRIILSHRAPGSQRSAGAAAVAGYPMIRLTEEDDGILITHPIYIDGLNANTFMQAVYAVSAGGRAMAEPSEAEAAAETLEEEEEAGIEPEAGPVEGEAEEGTQVQPVSEQPQMAWQPTHRVLPGMKVWPEPDPQAQPIAQFQEPGEVSVEEERGAWARIRRSDGWGGWVDGRRLESLTTEPAHAQTQTEPQETAQAPAQASRPQDLASWAPTHEVPAGGMGAWAEPDPQLQPVARLSERVQLRIDEQRGAWARVTGSNGWTGWVDARRLQPMGAGGFAPAAGTAAAAAAGGTRIGSVTIRLLTAIGAVVAGISVILPWLAPPGVAFGGGSSNAFDVPLPFLWNYSAGGDFRLGVVIIILAVFALGVAVVMKLDSRLAAISGALTLVIAVAFVVQLSRALSDGFGLGFGDAIGDWTGFGVWLALGGGVLMVVGALTDR